MLRLIMIATVVLLLAGCREQTAARAGDDGDAAAHQPAKVNMKARQARAALYDE